ncbi:hypothetical protein RFI_07544 [Reticulomyxa filosa]|uniref:CCHC-type domain-containing protein n=1 Tax=Reticulomyxa filosa TaxID=46433 RepID=X6NTG6_RETFI|nr:hypothetical protein RFI_07544 [Reticulomyxa filosa]|eukprot:ETO29575.1 hypothetical protein RFI_07544 [Reticulomyxa filosa]
MGVPSFFRWLLEKYPRIIQYVIEEDVQYDDQMKRVLPDSSRQNVECTFIDPSTEHLQTKEKQVKQKNNNNNNNKKPNGTEFDNLYLDMNGIIHNCCHPENSPQPETEEEMIKSVFDYVLHLFSMVRPRKLLYLAIDGVAPRAKMNQQRSRRFRAAQERQEFEQLKSKLELFYTLKYTGKHNDEKKLQLLQKIKQSWDHNVITPGFFFCISIMHCIYINKYVNIYIYAYTFVFICVCLLYVYINTYVILTKFKQGTPFMDKLSKALRHWIPMQLHSNPGWKNIKVIFSDANIPGEGEHKIASFIRRTRGQPGYDPNTRHVFYGLDADLFMLSLATHEIYMTILREEVLFGKNRPCERCGMPGHFMTDCVAEMKTDNGQEESLAKLRGATRTKVLKPFIFAHLLVLREYLSYELYVPNLTWGEWNLERAIDDFIFLCFFVGNDFLPHLPSLDIREGALDNLIEMYKQFLPTLGGYLTDGNGMFVHMCMYTYIYIYMYTFICLYMYMLVVQLNYKQILKKKKKKEK